jgi:hypothetical protein
MCKNHRHNSGDTDPTSVYNPPVISRRHKRFVIALLLPLMVLRAMLPAGFMPVAENGVLRIALCSDGLYPAVIDQGKDHEHGGNHKLPSDSGNCPFANAAANAPPPVTTPILLRIDSDAGAILAPATPVSAASIVRVQSARGPPSISV